MLSICVFQAAREPNESVHEHHRTNSLPAHSPLVETKPAHDGAPSQPSHEGAPSQPSHEEALSQRAHEIAPSQPADTKAVHEGAPSHPAHERAPRQPAKTSRSRQRVKAIFKLARLAFNRRYLTISRWW